MPAPSSPLVTGARCLAGPGGYWQRGTVRRVNEDGTCQIECDEKDLVLMKQWFGVTPAEVSVDDELLWPSVFERLTGGSGVLRRDDFQAVLTGLGYAVDQALAENVWDEKCGQLFGGPAGSAIAPTLAADQAYELFASLGNSARRCHDQLDPPDPPRYFKTYWNQTRMGGRDPGDLPRAVTPDDAFAALGVGSQTDARLLTFLQDFTREHAVQLPARLVDFFSRSGIEEAVCDCHPNNPRLPEFRDGDWKLRRDLRAKDLKGDFGVSILVPHQGDHEWIAVFDEGDDDARIYLQWLNDNDVEIWHETAPSLSLFFWDLAQTGLAWYQDTQFQGGRPVKRTGGGKTSLPQGNHSDIP